MKPNPFIDIIATIMVMLTLIVGGYFYLTSEADKVLQNKQHPEQKHEKTAMEKYAPKSFAAVVKRTETE